MQIAVGQTHIMSSIVIYFSRSGNNWVNDGVANLEVGNCEILAKYTQQKTNSDIFRIETKRQYTDDYYKAKDEAKEELERNARPELVSYPENMEKYDTIYLVFPIWFSNCPMAVFSLLERYDFGGKTIVPLCSHEGGGVGESVENIKNIAKGAIVKDIYETRGYKCQNLANDKIMQNGINAFLEKNK